MSKTLSLTFKPLPAPMGDKLFQRFRREAGWSAGEASHVQAHPYGRVQWVTVESGRKTVGIARLEMAPPEFCYVSELIVAREYRGQGIGQWFVKNIEQYCLQSGIRRLTLQPHPGTEQFYGSLQFAPDPRVPNFITKDINPFQKRVMPGIGR